ncbi:hypothetical protein SAMN04488020_101336 [Palleronia marisminoris]|uniref:Uncharacterized protein n=1 Tax=Palleronia marisminoris TaxID=315423 RepID=A0A1Y5REH7_9RHOB|nr:hypothetical protein [Palleronia marisminoris]SFG15447.1 hypothetical protein SAMN04488020_101336 [Palleronia marisminoris]SLN15660.1 hypothetical protein PAM7066_00336 [Palleronia marisminoris]
MSNQDRDEEAERAKTGAGTTDDPNQANRTPMPKKEPIKPDVKPDPDADPDNPATGQGSTNDPNQANRT